MGEREAWRLETEALIEAIWGRQAPEPTQISIAPAERERQNAALGTALRAYLQQYLADAGMDGGAAAP